MLEGPQGPRMTAEGKGAPQGCRVCVCACARACAQCYFNPESASGCQAAPPHSINLPAASLSRCSPLRRLPVFSIQLFLSCAARAFDSQGLRSTPPPTFQHSSGSGLAARVYCAASLSTGIVFPPLSSESSVNPRSRGPERARLPVSSIVMPRCLISLPLSCFVPFTTLCVLFYFIIFLQAVFSFLISWRGSLCSRTRGAVSITSCLICGWCGREGSLYTHHMVTVTYSEIVCILFLSSFSVFILATSCES